MFGSDLIRLGGVLQKLDGVEEGVGEGRGGVCLLPGEIVEMEIFCAHLDG